MHSKKFSKREQQIMEILYQLGEASAKEVMDAMPASPSYSTVRTLLGILAQKGDVKYRIEAKKYIYRPTEQRAKAGTDAFKNLLKTFYKGSLSTAVAGLISSKEMKLDEKEIDKLSKLIAEAKEKGD